MNVKTETIRESVIERLRVSKANDAASKHAAGLADGRAWAQRNAKYNELRTLEEQYSMNYRLPNQPTMDWVVSMIDRKEEPSLDWADLISGPPLESVANEPNFTRGFVVGALEIWDDVKDEI